MTVLKLIYFLILPYLIYGCEPVENLKVKTFNETHLILSWSYTKTEIEQFLISIDIPSKLIENNEINYNISVEYTHQKYYTHKIEYKEGTKYELTVKTCTQIECECPQSKYITTSIKLNLKVNGCNNNKYKVKLNDEKINGQKHLCISSRNVTYSEYPEQNKESVLPCNQSDNIQCNANHYFFGYIKNDLGTKFEYEFNYLQEKLIMSNTDMMHMFLLMFLLLLTSLIILILVFKLKQKSVRIPKLIAKIEAARELIQEEQINNSIEMVPIQSKKLKPHPLNVEELNNLLKSNSVDVLTEEYEEIPNLLSEPKEENSYRNNEDYNIVKGYIKGYNKTIKYIVAQTPTTTSFDYLWAMIWQESVETIILLSDPVKEPKKQLQYWPILKKSKTYDKNLIVNHTNVNIFTGFTQRQFELNKLDDSRKLNQIHFNNWPDCGVPPNNFINFIQFFRNQEIITPVLVQSRNGLGRTGSFILCDYLIDQIEATQCVDFPMALNHLRKSINGMVNNAVQYKQMYESVLKYLKNNTEVDSNLNSTVVVDYIKINNFYKDKSYTCTQTPKSLTNFWNMIDAQNIQLIVILQSVQTLFWPTSKTSMKTLNNFRIERNSVCKYPSFEQISFKFTKEEVCRKVDLMYFKKWEEYKYPNEDEILHFILQTINNTSKNITVICHNGLFASGIYMLQLKIMEQIQNDNAFDISNAIKSLRSYNENFLTDEEQQTFAYNLISKYMDLNLSPLYHTVLQDN